MTIPCPDRAPDGTPLNSNRCDCGMCAGTYCAQHFNRPCECDVIDRHESVPLLWCPDCDYLTPHRVTGQYGRVAECAACGEPHEVDLVTLKPV